VGAASLRPLKVQTSPEYWMSFKKELSMKTIGMIGGMSWESSLE
jgi:hypothetical protein